MSLAPEDGRKLIGRRSKRAAPKGVSQDIFRQGLLPVPIVSGEVVSGMHAESAVMPGHEFFNKPVVYPALSLQHGQDLGTEDLFQLFPVSLGQAQDMLLAWQ